MDVKILSQSSPEDELHATVLTPAYDSHDKRISTFAAPKVGGQELFFPRFEFSHPHKN